MKVFAQKQLQQQASPNITKSSAKLPVKAAVPPIVHEALHSSGQPVDPTTRGFMESRFGRDFSRVRVHTDSRAAESADAVNAFAYTVGQDVVFGAGQYAPGVEAGRRLLAHELAHVAQQQGHTGSLQRKSIRLSHPEEASERKADAAAESVLSGRAAPDLGSASPDTLYRAVKTNGGSFDTSEYIPINDASSANRRGIGKVIGANIHLNFTPNDLVEADHIGLIQTVKTLRSRRAGGPINIPDNARTTTLPDALTAGEGDEGRGIDQLAFVDRTRIPQTNPLYATTNTRRTTSRTLTDVLPDPAHGWGDHGHHKRKADGSFEPSKDAELIDTPRRSISFVGQMWTQSFEVAALVLDGPMANTYLGSIAWGWENDAAGTATLNPARIAMVQAGVPSLAFRQAGEKWNRLTFRGPRGRVFETVDLPIPTDMLESGTQPASARTTANLILWLRMIDLQISQDIDEGIKAAKDADEKARKEVDKANKIFEKRAMMAELEKRNVEVEVHVIKTEDATGADEVYVQLGSDKKTHKTKIRSLNNGQTGLFTIPLKSLLPIKDLISVKVFDEDSPDADDLIVYMNWVSPFGAIANSKSHKGANYRVKVKFDK